MSWEVKEPGEKKPAMTGRRSELLCIFKRVCIIAVTAALLVPVTASGVYVTTLRDTSLPESRVEYELTPVEEVPEGGDGYVFLAEAGYLRYYFRDDRDIFAITDLRNGYTWKTGIDVPFNQDIDNAISAAYGDDDAVLEAAIPKEDNLNATYIGIANSLLSVEYFDDAYNISTVSSASRTGASSTLMAVGGEPLHYVLDVHFSAIKLDVKMHIYLTGDGLLYEIFDEDITGENTDIVASLILTPFLGASGGRQRFFDPALRDYGESVRKPMTPGYVMIPDGPGALIRFRENNVSFNRYIGNVFGVNLADAAYHTSEEHEVVPYKEPLMPVFGIAHGDRQAAFVFWADKGAENLQLIVSPENNLTSYTYAYPRFVLNQVMYQVYNRAGQGYNRLYPERNHADISATYTFLAGDGSAVTGGGSGSYPADYTGMALAYREHLLKTGVLAETAYPEEMPLHIDFIMSDIKRGILGFQNVVVTTADDAGGILRGLHNAGVSNINAGLLGAQRGGITGGTPQSLSFSRSIGTRGDFRELISEMNEVGYDVYFTQDYSAINSRQMFLSSNMAYHRSNWGVRRYIQYENTSVPVTEVAFARPAKSAQWLVSQSGDMKRAGASAIGIEGVSSRLISHYGQGPMSAQDAISLMQETIAGLGMTVSAYTPNMYLWGMTDRFINAPLMPTQYIIETDTVPFLQMVLHGTMEVYGPYANFSFYTKSDILRMIDYNVFPSFVLTEEPAYLLAETNSSGYYSTSFDLYFGTIVEIYGELAAVYRQTRGQPWTGRDVPASGVILNTYGGGTQVLINYTDEEFVHNGVTVAPVSAEVIGG